MDMAENRLEDIFIHIANMDGKELADLLIVSSGPIR